MPSEDPRAPLADKMRRLADTGHPRAAELREHALAFEAACAVADNEWNARQMLGVWARARRVWSECSGEPLI